MFAGPAGVLGGGGARAACARGDHVFRGYRVLAAQDVVVFGESGPNVILHWATISMDFVQGHFSLFFSTPP